ncbi:sigma-54 dependent transcriptional regulator [Roseovarius sp. MBR-6]|uniref:sigma-54-dependent transcriptional regulator n=1 Tax=Roseovarius sp. MBR-6 TaxID=3156459 RepID=UPI0033979E0D
MSIPHPPRILIVEDDRAMRLSLIDLLEASGWCVEALPRADRLAGRLEAFQPDVILSDVRMPGMSGLELLDSLDRDLSPPLVLISAHGDIAMAVDAMQRGAYSFVEKPYEPRRLLNILHHAADQHAMRRTTERLKSRLMQLSGLDRVLLGQTPETVALREEVLDLSQSGAAVMVQGETGTGKELVARALHDLGADAAGPFVALNCAALAPEGFEAEMFGTEGGARGRLAGADGGTLFLDEICSCPMPVQAKLLRVIEDKQVLPIGAEAPVPLRFRVISATNEDPGQAVREGRLRADLLYRLNTTVIALPTLRQRRDDVILLAARFLDEFARVYETRAPDLAPEDSAALLSHDWPGNVRELRSVCERRVLSARRGGGSMVQALRRDALADDVPDTLRAAVAAFERDLIAKAITAHEGRMEAVAEALGIGRRTLNEKIVKLGLDKGALL